MMVGWWLGAQLFVASAEDERTDEPIGVIELTKFSAYHRRQAHDNFLTPYIFDTQGSPQRLLALEDGRVLKHADFARRLGDEERAREIERVIARDKRLLYSSLALTGGSLLLSLTASASSDPLPQGAAALGLALGGLGMAIPPAVAGRKIKALRYTRDEVEHALAQRPLEASSEAEIP